MHALVAKHAPISDVHLLTRLYGSTIGDLPLQFSPFKGLNCGFGVGLFGRRPFICFSH